MLIIKDGRFDLVKELPDSTIYPAGHLSDSLKLVSMLYLIISNVQNSGVRCLSVPQLGI